MVESCVRKDLTAHVRSFLLFWGIPIIGVVGASFLAPTPRGFFFAGSLLWAGGGCLLNTTRCGRLHCYLTGPLFVAGGAAILLKSLDVVSIPAIGIGVTMAVGTVLAYGAEWLLGTRYSNHHATVKESL